jgi:hypothetical protein
MTKKNRTRDADTGPRNPTDREIDDAMNEAALDALYAHLDADLPMAVWKNGQVAWVHPSTIRIPKSRQRRREEGL